jgi:ABC-type transport system involved in cytochrome c biogenesis permease subunit
LDIASKLSDPVVRELSEQEALIYLRKAAPGLAASGGARAMAMMEMIAENAIFTALEGKPLSEFSQEGPFEEVFASYKAGDAEEFNKAVEAYHITLKDQPPEYQDAPVSVNRLTFESFFNNAAPFYYLAAVYLIAGLLAAASWLTRSQPLNRATFWLLCFCLVVHTAALAGRIYISGRPPVTTLYSSAVFIGWGCVLMGLLFEWFYDMGMGNLVAAVAGFLTLGVAHLLTTEVASFRGDTFPVLLAVLDTQFWLATHVVCISMGYAATYMTGLMGAAYILGGAFTPMLNSPRRKDLLRMMYATLCFAIFFSFVGTVLGGLWADDSWGRFWGWDTKENGALIIVLWNALVLHARWGGIVKERGLACLAVAGNICVSWSWFGVNELGIGLHSYGFTEGVLPKLALFCVSQLLLIGIGCLPKEYWWSHIAEQSEAKA